MKRLVKLLFVGHTFIFARSDIELNGWKIFFQNVNPSETILNKKTVVNP